MKCKRCDSTCIKNGFQINGEQRYLCKMCKISQQKFYNYNAYKKKTNETIIKLLVNSCGIRDISRVLSISKTTVMARILFIADKVKWPAAYESKQIYEVDELCVKMKDMHRCWVSYAINRKSKKIIDFSVGSNNKNKLGKIINNILGLNPNTIYTDGLSTYRNLIPANIHSDRKFQTNTIERFNLNLRTHLKGLSRKTICFSKNILHLIACVRIYFWYSNLDFNNKKYQFSLPQRGC